MYLKSPVFPELLKYCVLSFIICILSFPDMDCTYPIGIDESLAWVFNHLADGHLKLCKEIIFPHGPLAFLMYPLPMGNNLIFATLFYFVMRGFLAFNIFYLY